MSETVGPERESVEHGSRVWVRWNNRVWDGVLIGPGPYEYEVIVAIGSERENVTVHRHNVQPQRGQRVVGDRDLAESRRTHPTLGRPPWWRIRSTEGGAGEVLYWSNRDGWVPRADADKFVYGERETLSLPIGGEWEAG